MVCPVIDVGARLTGKWLYVITGAGSTTSNPARHAMPNPRYFSPAFATDTEKWRRRPRTGTEADHPRRKNLHFQGRGCSPRLETTRISVKESCPKVWGEREGTDEPIVFVLVSHAVSGTRILIRATSSHVSPLSLFVLLPAQFLPSLSPCK